VHTIVISSGTRPVPSVPSGRVIVADGGLDRALAAGLTPDIVVGDMDSVNQHTLRAFLDGGGAVHAFPTDKNATDLELALDLVEPGVDLTIIGGDGDDRFDHFVGELTHIAARADGFASVTVLYPHASIRVVTSGRSVQVAGPPRSIVSLIPMLGGVQGVVTEGLRWPLQSEELPAGTTRGLSNELVGPLGDIHIAFGTLLVIQPLSIQPAFSEKL
jgi:thiamine pyrophosphokinase